MPSIHPRCRSKRTTKAASRRAMSQGSSARSTERAKGSGTSAAVKPSTRPMLVMLEPMALPIASSGLPLQAAGGGDEHLRCGGAERDDGQTDQQLRHAEIVGGGGRAIEEAVCAPDERHEPEYQGDDRKPHRRRVPGKEGQAGCEGDCEPPAIATVLRQCREAAIE